MYNVHFGGMPPLQTNPCTTWATQEPFGTNYPVVTGTFRAASSQLAWRAVKDEESEVLDVGPPEIETAHVTLKFGEFR